MITEGQTERIKKFLESESFTNKQLMDDLVDHLSCDVEHQLENNIISFEKASEISKQKILPKESIQVQQDLEFLTTKNSNIMIKKIAFIGGYVSAFCLCLAILFFSQSLLGAKRVKLKSSAIEVEYYQDNPTLESNERRKVINEALNEYSIQQILNQANKFDRAEILLIISVLTFGLSYLPYRFYASFRGSELQTN